jgi:hypothetical protein
MSNYRNNTNALVYRTHPIPQDVLNIGREITRTFVTNIANRIIDQNEFYLRYFNGEISREITYTNEYITRENIINNITSIVDAHHHLLLVALRNSLGSFWVPIYAAPINIDSSLRGMEIDDLSPTPYEGMEITESPPTPYEGMEITE